MNLRELLMENIERTGKGDTAVVGWGRGMGHKGHMYLASSVITHAKELGGDPYFVVSRTVGKDDPITPEEKLAIYKKVFPQQGHVFQTATDEIPDLTRVLTNLNQKGYRNAVIIVGSDQVKAFQYLKKYNSTPDKSGNTAFSFDNLDVISRQETNDPSKGEEGPRATPMRQVLMDPSKSEQEQFAVWRDAMNPEINDDEVRDLMNKAKERMTAMQPAPKKATVKKKPLTVSELFTPGKDWKWSFKGSEEAVAVFYVGEIPYQFNAHGGAGVWEVSFKNAKRGGTRGTKFGLTGTGNSAEVMSTVADIMRAFLKEYQGKIKALIFTAAEESRQSLYARMTKKLLPNWTIERNDKEFVLVAPKASQSDIREGRTVINKTTAVQQAPEKSDKTKSIVVSETIEKHGSQYRLVSKHGHKNLGTYDTKAGAKQREREVQYFKNKKEAPKQTKEAAYPGNIGIMELIKFFNKAKDNDPELVRKVKGLIADNKNKEAWHIIQKYTGVKLQGVEFNESIFESIKQEAARLRKQ